MSNANGGLVELTLEECEAVGGGWRFSWYGFGKGALVGCSSGGMFGAYGGASVGGPVGGMIGAAGGCVVGGGVVGAVGGIMGGIGH